MISEFGIDIATSIFELFKYKFLSREWALSNVGTHSDIALDVARKLDSNNPHPPSTAT